VGGNTLSIQDKDEPNNQSAQKGPTSEQQKTSKGERGTHVEKDWQETGRLGRPGGRKIITTSGKLTKIIGKAQEEKAQ